jgi:hypothetical protein
MQSVTREQREEIETIVNYKRKSLYYEKGKIIDFSMAEKNRKFVRPILVGRYLYPPKQYLKEIFFFLF